jgi:dCTP deaminase
MDIKRYMDEGKLEIEPFFEKNLTPNGYDLTIEEVLIPAHEEQVKDGTAIIAPMQWFLISTKEYVKFGGEITAQLWIRTTYARKGIMSSFGKIDSGFHGTLTLSALNSSPNEVEIKIGETFAQMVFERMESPPQELYDKRSGTYQGQRGVTAARK